MLMAALTVARKEIVDHSRDLRALGSTGLYVLMGPLMVLLVGVARTGSPDRPDTQALVSMAAVFAILSAFTAGMGVAMDTISGERERRSLVPLLLDVASVWSIVVGKWLGACAFAIAGVALSIGAFASVLSVAVDGRLPGAASVLWVAPPVCALALCATALELLVAAGCRTTKEAHTWLMILVFVLMGLAIWLAFRPAPGTGAWSSAIPLAGQQRLLAALFARDTVVPTIAIALTLTTAAIAPACLAASRWLLQESARG
jgi:sodium transport system permease protein